MAQITPGSKESRIAHDIRNFCTSLCLDDHIPFRHAKLDGQKFLKRIDELLYAAITTAAITNATPRPLPAIITTTNTNAITMADVESSARNAVLDSLKEPNRPDAGRMWVERIVNALEAYLAEVVAMK